MDLYERDQMSHHAAFKNGNLIGVYKNCIPQHVRASAEEIITINDLDHLVSEMDRRDKRMEEVTFSDGDFLNKCLNKLDDLNVSCEKLKQEGKKIVVEAKSGAVSLRNRFTDFFDDLLEDMADSIAMATDVVEQEEEDRAMPYGEKDASDIFPSQKTPK